MKQLTILIVEDDKSNRDMLKAAFQEDGHIVCTAASVGECHGILQKNKPDIIILDRGLPDGDGIQLCLTVKKDALFKSIPILMLTGKAEVKDRILGLRWGADDYLAKPFDIGELLARVSALARRVYGDAAARLTKGGIMMDIKARTVFMNKAAIELTNREFSLLRVFLENPGTVLTRDFLIASVWNDAGTKDAKIVDVTVSNLRRKLGAGGSQISAVRSFGYKFIG